MSFRLLKDGTVECDKATEMKELMVMKMEKRSYHRKEKVSVAGLTNITGLPDKMKQGKIEWDVPFKKFDEISRNFKEKHPSNGKKPWWSKKEINKLHQINLVSSELIKLGEELGRTPQAVLFKLREELKSKED